MKTNIKALQLHLKTKWFRMTESGEKKEDYREITPYWVSRLVCFDEEISSEIIEEFICELKRSSETWEKISDIFDYFGARFKVFKTNRMTLGYPKKTDKDRIIEFEHAGIEASIGNPEWGAEAGEMYFIVKHGKRIINN